MMILGVDPGYDRCGWAVIQSEGGEFNAIAFDCLQTSKKQSKVERFKLIHEGFVEIFSKFPIDEIAMESLFFSRNVSTALPVSEVRGLLYGLAIQRQLPLSEYAPATIKISATGYGRAEKNQVMKMVTRLLKLEKIPKIDDTGDALAVALTHALQAK